MDIDKTMEFILEQQARFEENQAKFEENQVKFEENFLRADERFAKAEKRLDRLDRLMSQMPRMGLRFRNQLRRSQVESEKRLAILEEKMSETTDKLNALIDVVDRPCATERSAREAQRT